jgi:hypothetical protein
MLDSISATLDSQGVHLGNAIRKTHTAACMPIDGKLLLTGFRFAPRLSAAQGELACPKSGSRLTAKVTLQNSAVAPKLPAETGTYPDLSE